VAAWIIAETGVGPSMASGSQTWSGNWALLPTAPRKMSSAMIAPQETSSVMPKPPGKRMIASPRPATRSSTSADASPAGPAK
jgi:hypothetical protein